MDKQGFDESWPHYSEGATFSDGQKIRGISEERNGGWKTSNLIKGAAGYGGLAWAIFGDDPARIAAVMAALAFLFAAYVSGNLREQTTKIRQELELLKGGIRENRFLNLPKDD